jgi:DNA invertase Pin-like site-specific DNA recombinase
MDIGYAWVSTHDQHLDLQQDALQRAGCTKIIVDCVSGTVAERQGLAILKDLLREGDTLVVWRLDRLGRSIQDLITWVAWLEQEGIGLRSLHEAIDTTTPSGKLTFHIFASLGEFERHLIQEQTQAGLRAASARRRSRGRPKALQGEKRALAVQLYYEKKHTVQQICEMMGISKPTLYAYVQQARSALGRVPHKKAERCHVILDVTLSER